MRNDLSYQIITFKTLAIIRETAKRNRDFLTWVKANKELTRRGWYLKDVDQYV